MNERLIAFLKSQGLTSRKLAERLGVQPSGISHIISGRNKPGFDFLVKMIQVFPELNPDWLLMGSGNMYRDINFAVEKEHAESTLFEENETIAEPVNESAEIEQQRPDYSSNVTPAPIIPVEKPEHVTQIIVCYDDKTFTVYNQRFK